MIVETGLVIYHDRREMQLAIQRTPIQVRAPALMPRAASPTLPPCNMPPAS